MNSLSWETFEYIHTEKTSDWYWIVGIITISIAVISIILNNVIFAILILVASFTLSLFASRKPSMVLVNIDNSGVRFGNTFHPYHELISFWVETGDAFPRVLIKSNKTFMPFIVIHIADEINTNDVKNLLANYLPEEENTEPLLEKIMIYLGF